MCDFFIIFILSTVLFSFSLRKLQQIYYLQGKNEAIYRYYLPAELYSDHDNKWLFIDQKGNIWEWEDNEHTFSYDTIYLLSMDTNHTYEIKTDDIILTIWQEGGEENSYG